MENASSKDSRPEKKDDPMEAHRHRIHPLLWEALSKEGATALSAELRRERAIWQDNHKKYVARRPVWSVSGAKAPWETIEIF